MFIVLQAVFSRKRKNSLTERNRLLQELFDTQIMQHKIEIQESTFDSLGAELHDNIGQLLSTAKMFIGITERKLDHPPSTLQLANETLDRAIKALRDLSKSLNKDWLQEFDLYRNLLADIDSINSAGGLRISIKRQTHILPVPPEQQFLFYRLLQEAIQNVIKHAEATSLSIAISYDENNISTSLEDDGKGFDPKAEESGLGIKIMKQRINSLKGKISWTSSSTGTVVEIIFPTKKLGA